MNTPNTSNTSNTISKTFEMPEIFKKSVKSLIFNYSSETNVISTEIVFGSEFSECNSLDGRNWFTITSENRIKDVIKICFHSENNELWNIFQSFAQKEMIRFLSFGSTPTNIKFKLSSFFNFKIKISEEIKMQFPEVFI